MCGCSEQKYLYSPAAVNVNEKVPSVSIVFDRNLPAQTTVCGMSSRLVQVTVCADLHRELGRLEDEVVDMHGHVIGCALGARGDDGQEHGRDRRRCRSRGD